MGCSQTRPPTYNVIHEYTHAKLTVPNSTEYENDFEKEAFMMINLIRHEPKKFITHVKQIKNDKQYKGKNWAKLIEEMNSIQHPLPFVTLDQDANRACRQNNSELLKDQTKEPAIGGNMTHYQQILGSQAKTPNAEESTVFGWTGTAHELVLLNLLQEFEKTSKPALLDPLTTKVGMSFQAHKKTQNLFQILYVKSNSNNIE